MMNRLAELFRSMFGDREDPIMRMRREARENAIARLEIDKKRALDELAAG
jgi:uncharacterized protein YbjQ (UPF0145 family)